ncbi:hypothetical protein ACHWQZ_G000265 [Mnemiopsis leidyi]
MGLWLVNLKDPECPKIAPLTLLPALFPHVARGMKQEFWLLDLDSRASELEGQVALEPMQREGEEGLKREEITVSANIKYKMM